MKPDFVVAGLTARCGDARPAPPPPAPKSLAAAPFPIFREALKRFRFPSVFVESLKLNQTGSQRIGIVFPLACSRFAVEAKGGRSMKKEYI